MAHHIEGMGCAAANTPSKSLSFDSIDPPVLHYCMMWLTVPTIIRFSLASLLFLTHYGILFTLAWKGIHPDGINYLTRFRSGSQDSQLEEEISDDSMDKVVDPSEVCRKRRKNP